MKLSDKELEVLNIKLSELLLSSSPWIILNIRVNGEDRIYQADWLKRVPIAIQELKELRHKVATTCICPPVKGIYYTANECPVHGKESADEAER